MTSDPGLSASPYLLTEAEQPAPRPDLDVAAISDIGLRRANNEDCFGYDLESGLFVVCDGIGGRAAGEVASRLAVDEMLMRYGQLRSRGMPTDKALIDAIFEANREVWAAAQQRAELRGMATTLVAACLDRTRLTIASVGDSRAYFLRGERCFQITRDHVAAPPERSVASLASHDAGAPMLVTRALGAAQVVNPDLFVADLRPGDTVLLTTDGLTRYAQTSHIADTLLRSASLPVACRELLLLALRDGAEDNVTCLVLRLLTA